MATFAADPAKESDIVEATDDPRLYMAAERTFLAWIRTGIALIGLGFIVARFGLFLRELAIGRAQLRHAELALSMPIGIALIGLGILTLANSAYRHHRYVRALDRGEFRSAFDSRFLFFIVGLLTLIGLVMGIYLGMYDLPLSL